MKEIPLTKGKTAIVDDKDYEEVSKYKWFFDSQYACRNIPTPTGQKKLRLHNFIMGKGLFDHANRNKLDNTRKNLRPATKSQNVMNRLKHKDNTSGFKGVVLVKRDKRYQAQITYKYKRIYIGYFKDPIDAAKAYNKKALELFGEFAVLNKV